MERIDETNLNALQQEQFIQQAKMAFANPDVNKIYPNLVGLLKEGTSLFDSIEKEVFLFTSITLYSGLINNIQGFYFDRYYSANLFLYILAPYGAGKGTTNIAKKLLDKIKEELDNKYKQAFKEWEADNSPSKPKDPPKRKTLFISLDNSKTGVIENINNNDGEGIMFETESDRLSDTLRTEHGNYSDILRQIFHQEELSYNRRTNKEHVEVDCPRIANLLTGTEDQLLKLIPSVENGLFSRFCYYQFYGTDEFVNPFDRKRHKAIKRINELAVETADFYNKIQQLQSPIQMELTPLQISVFMEIFSYEKKQTIKELGSNVQGSVHRLALQVFRVCLILTAIRLFDDGEINTSQKTVYCNDTDFMTAIRFGGIFKENYLKAMEIVPLKQATKFITKEERDAKIRALRKEGKTQREIIETLKVSRSTIGRATKNR